LKKGTQKLNWKKLYNNIPARIKAGKDYYEVLKVKEFIMDKEQMGETRFNTKQIILKEGLSHKAAVETFYHEALHAWSDAHNIDLTEQQIIQAESGLSDIIRFVEELRK
jgi:hypothetical protein